MFQTTAIDVELPWRDTTVYVGDTALAKLTAKKLVWMAARQLEVNSEFFSLKHLGMRAPLQPDSLVQRVLRDDPKASFSLGLGPPPDVAPLTISSEVVGTERMMVTHLPFPGAPPDAPTQPIFLTEEQRDMLEECIVEPCTEPALTMLSGTIKSGKSTILHRVLPGMLAARHANDPSLPTPVFFSYAFPEGLKSPHDGVAHALQAMCLLANNLGLNVHPTPADSALTAFPIRMHELASHIAQLDGQLWVLLDEIQSPVLMSTSDERVLFTSMLKKAVENSVPHAKVVVTGSGMFSLVDAVRTHPVNGFCLWTSTRRVPLGTSYSTATAKTMAEALKHVHAPTLPVTPAQLAHDVGMEGRAPGLTSARPALIAHILRQSKRFLDIHKSGDPYSLGWQKVVNKLSVESTHDTARGLIHMERLERRTLLELAEGIRIPENVDGVRPSNSAMDSGLETLFEALTDNSSSTGERRVLQPPYPMLLRSWLLPEGDLAIELQDSKVVFPSHSVRTLQYLADHQGQIPNHIKAAISTTVLESLARNSVGVTIKHKHSKRLIIRPPVSVDEIQTVDAFQTLLHMLNRNGPSRAQSALLQAVAVNDAQYLAEFGFTFLLWIRQWNSHYSSPTLSTLFQAQGLTPRVIEFAVRSAVDCLKHSGLFDVDENGAVLEKGACSSAVEREGSSA